MKPVEVRVLPPAHHTLEACLDRIDRLGVFPEAAQRILQVTQDPNADLGHLEVAVASDPVLSARVLQVANSALYGQHHQVGSVRRAVQLLGLDATRAMAFALAVSALGRDGDQVAHDLYDHALVTAGLMQLLAPAVPGVHGGLMYVAALTHDIGLQLLLIVEPDATRELLHKLGHDRSLVHAERVHFGFDHAQLGGAGLRRWGLPAPAAELVEHHHQLVASQNRPRALLAVADFVAEGLMVDGLEPTDLADRGRWHPLAPVLGIPDEHWDVVADSLPGVFADVA